MQRRRLLRRRGLLQLIIVFPCHQGHDEPQLLHPAAFSPSTFRLYAENTPPRLSQPVNRLTSVSCPETRRAVLTLLCSIHKPAFRTLLSRTGTATTKHEPKSVSTVNRRRDYKKRTEPCHPDRSSRLFLARAFRVPAAEWRDRGVIQTTLTVNEIATELPRSRSSTEVFTVTSLNHSFQ